MPRRSRRATSVFPIFLCGVLLISGGMHFAPSRVAKAAVFPPPNSDPTYQQLRQIGLGREAFSVHHLVLKRDAATFTFESGTLVFLAPVNGKVTGAVFSGAGTFSVTPPIATEQKSLSLLTRQPSLFDTFSELALRFTDDTYPEIKISNAVAPAPSATVSSKYFDDTRNALRKDHHYNLDARILQDVLASQTGDLFIAFLKSARYGNRLAYWSDPHGSPHGMAPEEVQLATFDESRLGIWASYHYSREYQTGKASGKQNNSVFRIISQELDTQIQPNGELHGKAVTHIVSQMNGLRAIPFDLYHSLRVQSVLGSDGQPLSFIQEDQHADSDYWAILPNDLNAGQELSITTTYGGKDAVVDEGGANYYPVARGNWYPSRGGWGDFASYAMTFSIPKGMQLVATGSPTGDEDVAKTSATKWKSDQPQPVAGFQFGKFKVEEMRIPRLDNFEIFSFANQELPATFEGHEVVPLLGSLNTTGLIKKAMAEAELAVQLYTDYFGPNGFKRLAMTQQTATNYGQSWPEMVYLPITYFFDTTVRHQLGMDAAHGYFQVVAPHEVAHQWWGHTVSWASYRDQWMSEGFSDFSASLYIQLVGKDRPQDFVNFWNDEREMLTKKNAEGFRPIDVGPLTMGYRLNNSKSGFNITRELIYPKGAYILHMIRMMMWNQKTGDDDFKALMHDFVKTYSGQPATTEDFKAMAEKHMTQQMDLEGNGKMDWFFNEYVYGTALPTYTFDHTIVNGPNGDFVLNLKLTQSNVDDNFRMLIPIYLEMADGKIHQLARAHITGNHSIEQQVPLRRLKDRPRRALLNHYDDVLCTK